MYPFILYSTDKGFSFTGNHLEGDIGIISSYGFMLMLAFLINNYLLKSYIISKGENGEIADNIIFYAAIGGILGSKIYHIVEVIYFNGFIYYYTTFIEPINSVSSFINWFGGGLVFLGGLIGGLISVTLYIKFKTKYSWLDVADWVAPYLILGHAIGRIGCFLVGDCYGIPTDLPWGMQFPLGSPPSVDVLGNVETVHPTQLYEFLTGVLIFSYLVIIRKYYHRFRCQIFLEYLFLAGFARFFVELVRVNKDIILGLTGAQIISIIMIVVSSIFFYLMNRDSKKSVF